MGVSSSSAGHWKNPMLIEGVVICHLVSPFGIERNEFLIKSCNEVGHLDQLAKCQTTRG